MIKQLMLISALAIAALQAQAPNGLTTSTWVREDLFAGPLANDMERFARGMKKTNEILEANPRVADAICWRGFGELFLAAKAHESGQGAEFAPLYAKAVASFGECRKAAEGTRYAEAAYAITGGSWSLLADRLPAGLRRESWTSVKVNYTALQTAQKEYFDKMPPHMKGEVLAGLAQAAQRLGEDAELQRRLNDIVELVPGSVYASRARRWQEAPTAAATTSMTCQTCHDAGRLDAVLASRKQ